MKIISLIIGIVMVALPSFGLVAGPVFAALGAVLFLGLAAAMVVGRTPLRVSHFDWPVWLLVLAFGLWTSLTICSQCNLQLALEHSIQASLIFIGALLLLELARRAPIERLLTGEQLLRLVTIGLVIGVTILLVDLAMGFPLRKLFAMDNHPTQYNRGIAYVSLMILPALAFASQRGRWLDLAILVIAISLALVFGSNTTAVVAWVLAIATAVIAFYHPRLVRIALQSLVAVFFITAPWLIQAITSLRSRFDGIVKGSGIHRLEIWNYMAARIHDHPWRGWGLGTARELQVTEAERLNYLYVGSGGIYPHNQLLQLWVETGIVGVLLFLIFIQLVIWRIGKMAEAYRPFAFATLVMALSTALVNYEITTDSWWDCLAITSLLYIVWQRMGDGLARPVRFIFSNRSK